MPLPEELTFGVFDAAALEIPLPSPILLMCQVQVRAGKVFASLIDGGSTVNSDNSTCRYLTRSTTAGANACPGGEIPKPGDVVRLVDYSARRMSGKAEIVFVIAKLAILRHCPDAFSTLRSTLPYPFDTAPEKLRSHSKPQSTTNFQSSDLSTSCNENYDNRNSASYPQLHPPSSASGVFHGYNNNENRTAESSRITATSHIEEQQDQQYFLKTSVPSGQSNAAPVSDVSGWNATTTTMSSYGAIRKGNSTPSVVSESIPPATTSAAPLLRSVPYSASSSSAVQYRPAGPIARRTDGQFVEIKNLTSFLGRWIVKGRFINSGEPRTYSNNRGEGKLWSCDLIDSTDQSGTIRCTFFNKAVDKFHPLIKENEIYTVTRGTLRPANRKFNSGSHQFELQLGEDAQIQWIATDDPTIPTKPSIPITRIADLANVPKQTIVSICGVLSHASDVSEIVTRSTGQPRSRREITIVDDSGTCIDVTLWGSKASAIPFDIDVTQHPVVLVDSARVDEYNGRKLSSISHTDIQINPVNLDVAKRTHQWFSLLNQNGDGLEKLKQFSSLTTASWAGEGKATEHLTIAEIRQRTVDTPERDLEDRGCWFSCTATLIHIDKDRQFYWVACPTCGKKVTPSMESNATTFTDENHDESGFCGYCSKEVTKPIRKYLLNLEIADATGSLRCNAMGDKGLLIMGNVNPDVLVSLQHNNYANAYQRYDDYFLQRLRCEYIFKLQAKSETYRDETRIRYRIFGIDSLNAIISSDPPHGLNGIQTCRANLIKEGKRLLNWIYSNLPPS